MKTTSDYLALIAARYPETIRNDNTLAKFLGVTRQAISNYRGGQTMSVGVALKVAHALDVDPGPPVLSTLYHQASTEDERRFWSAMWDWYVVSKGLTE